MPLSPRPRYTWQLRSRALSLGDSTLIMGILNLTPDSFSDGSGELPPIDISLERARTLLDAGANILDMGAESTRPNATPLTPAQEQARLLPVLEALRRDRPDAILSVDTYHASTAQHALAAGAEIINEVSGLTWDEQMSPTIAASKPRPGLVLMHTRGTPQQWRNLPPLEPSTVPELVRDELGLRLQAAVAVGIPRETICLDPGIGFGKLGRENFPILAHLDILHTLRRPILIGVSRKGFLARTVAEALNLSDLPASTDRANAATAAHAAAILAGAHILRVHDVQPAREAAAIADALLDSL